MHMFVQFSIPLVIDIDCVISGLTNDAIASEVSGAKGMKRARDQTPKDSSKPSKLPRGWKVVTKYRQSGAHKGETYPVWESPDGQHFGSREKVAEFLAKH